MSDTRNHGQDKGSGAPPALLRVSVHGIGGRPHQGAAEIRLERDGHTKVLAKHDGAAFAEGLVEPGRYMLDAVAEKLVAPPRRLEVQPAGTTASVYLGEPGWPFYRLGENAIPIPPPADLLAVAFPTGKPDPETARRQAEEIARRLRLAPHPLPDPGGQQDRAQQAKSGTVSGGTGGFAAARGAVWLFRFPEPPKLGQRREAAKAIRDIVGQQARIGVPVDLLPGQVKVLDNRFVLRFRDSVAATAAEALVRAAGGTIRRRLRQSRNAWLVDLPEGDLLANLAAIEDWHRRDLLVYGEPDVMAEITDDVFPDTAPNDPTFVNQANLTLQQVVVAWRIMQRAGANLATGSPAIHVATLDRGLDLDHPDIGGNLTDGTPQIARSFDFSGMREMTAAGYAPDTDHGMGVYGIIAARADNGQDIAGIAPNTHQIGMERPDLTSANYPDILLWAAGFVTGNTTAGWPAEPLAPGAAIISCSHGSNGLALSGVMDDTLQELAANGRGGLGTIVIYSAGNDNSLITGFRTWAAHPDTLAIANSLQPDGGGVERKDPTSTFGPEIDVCAQGTGAPSLDDAGGEQVFGGTSAAAPTVAGIAALMLSRDPGLTRTEVRDILRATAVQIDLANTDPVGQWAGGFSQWYGFGRVNAASAVCGVAPAVTLLTPSVNFNSIPEGETTVRAVVLGVESCQPQRFEVVAGPGAPFTLPLGSAVQLEVGADGSREARVWIAYTGTTAGDTPNGSITVRWIETGQDFVVPIAADTITRPSVCLSLVLDRSGSMAAGSNIPLLPQRMDVLKFSVPPLIEVLQDNTGIGVVAFDTDAQAVMPVTEAGPPVFGAGRAAARDAVRDHATNPAGLTAIGDGVEAAHAMLAPETGYDVRATIVFTDGHETAAKYIADVADMVTDRVYAIGLGTADAIQPAALTALTNGTGGYMLLTGELGNTDTFLLAKYYLQILAGVTNEDIVLDPQGSIAPGQRHRIPFALSEADISADVILLCPAPRAVRLALETPAGVLVTPADAAALPGTGFVEGANVAYYRFTLPVPVGAGAAAGVWHAVLEVDGPLFKRHLATLERQRAGLYRQIATHGLPYSLNVHAYSNLRLRASLAQDGQEPGARLTLRAVLTEYGLPVSGRARLRAEVTRPDGTAAVLPMPETDAGVFEAGLQATHAGVYRCTVKAVGRTLRHRPFTREQIVTGQVWRGGNQPPPRGGDVPVEGQLCEQLRCLVDGGGLSPELLARLRALGLDLDALRKCCAGRPGGGRPPITPVTDLRDLIGDIGKLLRPGGSA